MSSSEWIPGHPYDALPSLPPAVDLESKVILKECITARTALAELKGAAELLPNQGILINTLPLLEARASSEIENIVTTTDKLFRFRSLDAQADPATKEALRYGVALLEGCSSLNFEISAASAAWSNVASGTNNSICPASFRIFQ